MSTLYNVKMTSYHEEGELLADYQSLSALAVIGFVVSLFSPLAFYGPMLAIVPILAAILNIAALIQASSARPVPKGKNLALIGLCLSLFCAVGGATFSFRRLDMMEQQARYVAEEWFAAAKRGEVHKIHQMHMEPETREPDVENLSELYENVEWMKGELNTYCQFEPIPTLVELGDAVDIKFHKIAMFGSDGKRDRVTLVYTLSFERDGERKESYVGVTLQRWENFRHMESGWRVGSVMGDYTDSRIPPRERVFEYNMDPVSTSVNKAD